VIGRELIKDETVALAELVKNSYDADGTYVRITLRYPTEPKLAELEIRDDGYGMSTDTVLNAWVEPATSFKRRLKNVRSPHGRVLLGEKGVGRFAVDKLGSKCELITRRAGEDHETALYLDSESYDTDVYLDEVKNQWEVRQPSEIKMHGTVIRITKLRAVYSRELVEKLHNALSKLVSPFLSPELPFDIQFKAIEYPDLTGKIRNPLPLERAPYSMRGSIDDNGTFTCVIKNEPVREHDLTTLDKEVKKRFQNRLPECGAFKITIYAWEKSPSELKKAGVDEIGNQYLKENFGVRIYRDGFRVLPYGDVDDDWLDLDGRRVQNPTHRIGRNRIFGWIEITREQNPKLMDKTNREGMIQEGRSYEDLRQLCVCALSLLEDYRYPIRPEARKDEKRSDVYTGLLELKRELKDTTAVKIVSAVENEYSHEVKSWEEQIERMADLAGIGVTVERITHEFEKTVSIAKQNQESLLKQFRGSKIDEQHCVKMIDATIQAIEVAETQLKLLSPLYFPQRGRTEDLSTKEVVGNVVFMLSDSLRSRNVSLEIQVKEDIPLRANKGKMLQVFVNLIDNALYWLDVSETKNPRILILIDGKRRTVTIADNGRGVHAKDVQNLFQPFFSTKTRGRGLGLYICKDVLSELGADITYVEDPADRILPGANFLMSFKRHH
jgi:signal transduction histidine kinase